MALNSNLLTFTAKLAAGTAFVNVGDIPALLAAARWSDTQAARYVSAIDKLEPNRTRPQALDDADWETLRSIWKERPEAAFPMVEADWQPYMEDFECAGTKPAWVIVPLIDDPSLNTGILRAEAEEEFKRKLRDAIEASTIQVRETLTMGVFNPRAGIVPGDFRGLVTAVAELERFAAQFSIAVVLNAHAADKPMDPRERTSLLRIIRALNVMANLKERGAATPIATQLQELGFDGPNEATIRKTLADARALDPDRNRNSG